MSFAGGHFVQGMIDIKPFGYGLPVFTDVYIDDIHGGLQLEPKTVITAGVGIGVIPIGTADAVHEHDPDQRRHRRDDR